MSWFADLFGFEEIDPEQVREKISLEGDYLVSHVNGAKYRWGRLRIPSLAELRKEAAGLVSQYSESELCVDEFVGDVAQLHQSEGGNGAHFQVASQFNLLEMVGPGVTPERGVGIYEHDLTQGPACAIACGAGTVYRNYFVPIEGQTGQSADVQIDCAIDLEKALASGGETIWEMKNGYLLPSAEGLKQANQLIKNADEEARDGFRASLRIGWQDDTQVTKGASKNLVSQAYGSAVPVSYSAFSALEWEPLARLILEASYEAAILTGLLNRQRTGNRSVYLTLLGGGAFGNPREWIFSAMDRALQLVAATDLKVAVVSYGRSDSEVRRFAGGFG